MKIILSRKGFDSAYGGHPSVILPDGTPVSFPIPGDEDEIPYGAVQSGAEGYTMDGLMRQFFSRIRYNRDTLDVNAETRCHLDPDLNRDAYMRQAGWRGCFGQTDAAQTVLDHACVGPGDLFLFFGWFKRCAAENDGYRYMRGDGFHAVYGYLQIGEIIRTHENGPLPEWLLSYHPHALKRRRDRKTNTIYIARESLSWDHTRPGYGLLRYGEATHLTAKGQSRSRWKLPDSLRGIKITYHSGRSWQPDYFQSACIGQEFVLEETEAAEVWARAMLGRV